MDREKNRGKETDRRGQNKAQEKLKCRSSLRVKSRLGFSERERRDSAASALEKSHTLYNTCSKWDMAISEAHIQCIYIVNYSWNYQCRILWHLLNTEKSFKCITVAFRTEINKHFSGSCVWPLCDPAANGTSAVILGWRWGQDRRDRRVKTLSQGTSVPTLANKSSQYCHDVHTSAFTQEQGGTERKREKNCWACRLDGVVKI